MNNSIKDCILFVFTKLFGRRLMYTIRYVHNRHRWPNFANPKDLSEILISRILQKEFEKYAQFVDKVKVREYVEKRGLGSHLLKHFGYWEDAYKINLEMLPEKFVLKASNGSGGKDIFICRDKRLFDIDRAKKQLSKVLKHKNLFEKHYNVIKPLIICEELIDLNDNKMPIDYKFTCIHGKPIDIFVGIEREKKVKFCTRNLDWSILDNTKKEYLPKFPPPKPKHLDEMIKIARILSSGFDFVRVDLYEYNDQVYFGELTFSPWGGILYSYTDDAINKYGQVYLNDENSN